MDNVLVSVLVPVYNVESYLDKCIESIVKQTYRHLEIILIDDGSTDRSPAICDEWTSRDDRIVVIHRPHSGASAARNSGLDFAHGAYIGFVDSDDYIEQDMYATLIGLLSDYNADIARVAYCILENNDKVIAEFEEGIQTVRGAEAITDTLSKSGHKSVAVWNKLIRKSVIGDIRFDTELIFGEDLMFLYQVYQNCNLMIINDIPLYNYRINSNQSSNKDDCNYQSYCTTCKIISDSNCQLSLYSKFFIAATMLLHDIVINNYPADYQEVKRSILRNRRKIFFSLKSPQYRVKLFLIMLPSVIYKSLLKVKYIR